MITIRVNAFGESTAMLTGLPASAGGILSRRLGKAAQLFAAEAKQEAPKGLNSQLVNTIAAEQLSPLRWQIRANTAHDEYVQNGRRPGKMPDMRHGSPFMEYVRLRVRPNGKARDLRSKRQYASYLQTAWAIGFSIKARGIAPNPYMQRTVDKHESRIVAQLRDEVRQDLARLQR